jgi:hypothetical protein
MSNKATLQKREYVGCNGKIYTQFRLNIPSWIIEKLGWSGQRDITFSIEGGNLVAKNPKSKR